MNLTHMEYFLVLAEEQSFSRAAEKLFISQPALTKALQAAESDLGLHLFTRRKRHVYPTPAGEVYLRYAARVRRLRVEAKAEIGSSRASQAKAPRFGVNRLLALGRYSDVFASFTQTDPNHMPDFFIMDSLVALRELKAGQLEVAVVLSVVREDLGSDVDAVRLFGEDLAVVVPDNGDYRDILEAGRRTGSVPVQLLDGRTAVKTVNMGNFQHIVTTYLSRYGVHPDYRYEFSNQFLSISLAENNQALCFCHRSLVKENLSSRTFCLEPPLRYHHYFCTRAGEPLSAQAQRFRSHLLSRS